MTLVCVVWAHTWCDLRYFTNEIDLIRNLLLNDVMRAMLLEVCKSLERQISSAQCWPVWFVQLWTSENCLCPESPCWTISSGYDFLRLFSRLQSVPGKGIWSWDLVNSLTRVDVNITFYFICCHSAWLRVWHLVSMKGKVDIIAGLCHQSDPPFSRKLSGSTPSLHRDPSPNIFCPFPSIALIVGNSWLLHLLH